MTRPQMRQLAQAVEEAALILVRIRACMKDDTKLDDRDFAAVSNTIVKLDSAKVPLYEAIG